MLKQRLHHAQTQNKSVHLPDGLFPSTRKTDSNENTDPNRPAVDAGEPAKVGMVTTFTVAGEGAVESPHHDQPQIFLPVKRNGKEFTAGFTYETTLGEGNFGIVFGVTDAVGTQYALKVIAIQNAKAATNEAEMMEKFNGDRFVHIYGWGTITREDYRAFMEAAGLWNTQENPMTTTNRLTTYFFFLMEKCDGDLAGKDSTVEMARWDLSSPMNMIRGKLSNRSRRHSNRCTKVTRFTVMSGRPTSLSRMETINWLTSDFCEKCRTSSLNMLEQLQFSRSPTSRTTS